jgi:hypothetical protein
LIVPAVVVMGAGYLDALRGSLSLMSTILNRYC